MSNVETPEGLLPIDSRVAVTGDTAGWFHGLAPGTPVRVVGYGDNGLEGYVGYKVVAYDDPEGWYVHPDDIRQEETSMPPSSDRILLTSPEIRTDGSPIIEPAQRTKALEWALERFPEDSVVDLVKLANWILEGEYR